MRTAQANLLQYMVHESRPPTAPMHVWVHGDGLDIVHRLVPVAEGLLVQTMDCAYEFASSLQGLFVNYTCRRLVRIRCRPW